MPNEQFEITIVNPSLTENEYQRIRAIETAVRNELAALGFSNTENPGSSQATYTINIGIGRDGMMPSEQKTHRRQPTPNHFNLWVGELKTLNTSNLSISPDVTGIRYHPPRHQAQAVLFHSLCAARKKPRNQQPQNSRLAPPVVLTTHQNGFCLLSKKDTNEQHARKLAKKIAWKINKTHLDHMIKKQNNERATDSSRNRIWQDSLRNDGPPQCPAVKKKKKQKQRHRTTAATRRNHSESTARTAAFQP